MTASARDLLRKATGALAPDQGANPFVPRVESGEAPREALARLALEQRWVIPADRRSFAHLAGRSVTGEEPAARHLTAFARACGVSEDDCRTYVPGEVEERAGGGLEAVVGAQGGRDAGAVAAPPGWRCGPAYGSLVKAYEAMFFTSPG
ncbi:hypothetical protein AB0D42_04435 [Streptomyces sp. NPDC048304]|uniref:hypothetical protein n=1 Tax=Streptomyces sp. NPDC048304 TaxID=3154820 RepID=UPI0034087BC0